ncbi:MAG: DUF1015 domain-containing protein [Deltaproteobacteria bacterium]|nr:DUF1015 domain-containing protein [Candidatus Deferrimicrobiaceae bacterium]
MAIVAPFRGIHFDPVRTGDLSKVISPPYDVISPEEQKALHNRHPRNIVWIDFGMAKEGDSPSENKYTRAAAHYRQWLAEGTLVQDAAPAFYYYEQEFAIPGMGSFVRKGFLGALRLSAFGEGEVLPHERTLSKPKEDRLALMRVTDAHMSPIFGLFSDPKNEVLTSLRRGMAAFPDFQATDDLGIRHRVWKVEDPAAQKEAARKMADKKVFIADGHHRYETALAFRDEMRKKHGVRENAAWEHTLMFLCNMDDEGIVILPTHRGVHSLPSFSEEEFAAKVRTMLPMETRKGTPEDAIHALEAAGKKGKAIAWSAGGGRFHLITFPDLGRFCGERLTKFPPELRPLDVVLLHGFLLEQVLGISPEAVTAGKHVKYYKDPAKAVSDLHSGVVQAAFFLNPVTVREFREVSLSGHVLPQKTTFFYPKILTGLLIFSARGDERVPA